VPEVPLVGRVLQRVVGKDSFEASRKMTVGYTLYSMKSGAMEPHRHAEEVIYVLDARDAWLRFGPDKDKLGAPVPFIPGSLVHFDEMEWHVFEYGENGYVDLIFIYGQVDNIRPEDNQ
jgi:hypothetical protein